MSNANLLRRRVGFAVALTLIVACGGDGASDPLVTPSTTPFVTAVTMTLASASLQVGQSTTASASALDQNGAAIPSPPIAWSSSNSKVATVTQPGIVTAIGTGTAMITATIGGKTGTAAVTVSAALVGPVASTAVSPANASLEVGLSVDLRAITTDAGGNALAGRVVTWSSSDSTKATVTASGRVVGIAAGTVTIVATSEGKMGSAVVVVTPKTPCTTTTATRLSVGEAKALSPREISSLCLGGLSTPSDYVLIPFNSSNVAGDATTIELASTNTTSIGASSSAAPSDQALSSMTRELTVRPQEENVFRDRELRDIGPVGGRARALLTGVSTTPVVGSTVQLNANLNGNTCTDAKVLHRARVVSVGKRSIVFADANSPAGGFTDAELVSFGAAFDTLVFALDTLYFGTPTDIDGNGRIGIFFTPGINSLPQPSGSWIGGLFASRDLFSPSASSGCQGSNQGEIIYMPVPDVGSTINWNYTDKSAISRLVLPTLAHELQHLINAGRRLYVNNALVLEQVWLNEGLSQIAEELLYYRVSGNSPRQNIDLPKVRSTPAQLDAVNTYALQNIGRYWSYLTMPTLTSPYSLVDGLGMRGAIWDLLRYAADRKAVPDERAIWYSLVNTTMSGQTNFNAVFGSLAAFARDWSVATFVDDAGIAAPPQYQKPSWNYRNFFTGLTVGKLPLATLPLVGGTTMTTTIVGGGAAYFRFRVSGDVAATLSVTSQGLVVSSNMDFMLIRTQ